MLRHAIEVLTAYLIFGLLRQAIEVLSFVSKVLQRQLTSSVACGGGGVAYLVGGGAYLASLAELE